MTQRRHFLKAIALVLALVFSASIMIGCGQSSTGTSSSSGSSGSSSSGNASSSSSSGTTSTAAADPNKGGRIVMYDGSPTEFFTPYKQGTMTSYGWCAYEPLAWDKKDNFFDPCLAKSWSIDVENKSMSITLNEGIRFSDGTPLTADDVVWTLSVRKDYGTDGLIGSPVSIEKVDDLNLVITWAEFSLNYEMWILPQYIYSKAAFEQNGLDWMLTNMMGSGPYILKEYIPDVHLLFTRNENYWRDQTPDPDEFEWIIITDATAALVAFLNGEIATIRTMDPLQEQQILAAGYEPYSPPNAQSSQSIALPITIDPNDPLANDTVRRAIYTGIDWDDLAKTTSGPTAFHTDAIGRPEMTYYKDSLNKTKYDPEAAKAAIAKEYPDGFDTTIYCMNMGNNPDMAAYMQDALKALNVRAEVVPIDYSLLNSEYLTGIATKSGIVLTGYFFYVTNQPDRFLKFMSPVGAFKGATNFPQELVDLWNEVPKATTYDAQDEALYNFVDAYVNKYALVWPLFNTTPMANYFNEGCRFEELSYCNSAGFDPMYMFAD